MNDSKENQPKFQKAACHKIPFRAAGLTDTIFIGRLLNEFYEKVGSVYGVPFDLESQLADIDEVIRDGICIVGPTSCAGAIFLPFAQNRKYIVAHLKFWYFQRKSEIRIFDMLRGLCQIEGANLFAAYSHFPDNRIGKFYRKKGLKSTEQGYMGNIAWVT